MLQICLFFLILFLKYSSVSFGCTAEQFRYVCVCVSVCMCMCITESLFLHLKLTQLYFKNQTKNTTQIWSICQYELKIGKNYVCIYIPCTIYVYPFLILSPYRVLQNIEYVSLHYIINFHWLSKFTYGNVMYVL